MKTKYIVTIMLCSLIFFRCEKAPNWLEGTPTDSLAPNPVTDVTVENLPGGVRIKYTLPDENDLLGVKAFYSYTPGGAIHESYASAFTDSIVLTGFPNTDERVVRLISIDKSLNESEPVNVAINPGAPPVELIFQSMEISPSFGGVLAKWENEANAEVGISLYAADENGDMKLDYTYFTDQTGAYAFRGFDDTERQFNIQIRDRWDNYSDIRTFTLKPLYEEQILARDQNGTIIWERYGYGDKSTLWRGDLPSEKNSGSTFIKMIDGSYTNYFNSGPPGNILGDYTEKPGDATVEIVPMYMTIDLGRSCKLSRHKLWHPASYVLRSSNLRSYELWATNETPKGINDFATKEESLAYWTSWDEVGGTDAWKNDWVKIADCQVTGPISGATELVDITDADKTAANANGFGFDIFPEQTATSFRYVRLVSQKNWQGGTMVWIGEFELWGAYDN